MTTDLSADDDALEALREVLQIAAPDLQSEGIAARIAQLLLDRGYEVAALKPTAVADPAKSELRIVVDGLRVDTDASAD